MRSFAALVQREFIEHRGAFLYAPLAIIAILVVFLGGGVLTGRFENLFEELAREFGSDPEVTAKMRDGAMIAIAVYAGRIFEFAFLAFSLGWMAYFATLIFFYTADAFAADKRNNSMLFWKSMPVSDLKVLLSKLTAATVLLPLIAFAAMLVTGLILAVMAGLPRGTLAGMQLILGAVMPGYLQVAGATLATLATVIVWYLPFVAWVGALSAVVGRWSIPLSFLIPGLLGLVENLLIPDTARGGIIWGYLARRMEFPNVEEGYAKGWITSGEPFDGMAFAADLLARIDLLQVGIGIAFAAFAIYAASEYRRRTLDN